MNSGDFNGISMGFNVGFTVHAINLPFGVVTGRKNCDDLGIVKITPLITINYHLFHHY